MLNEQTHQQLMDLRLTAMAQSFRELLECGARDELTFEERFGLMVDREWTVRRERRLKRRLSAAKLREQACVEDIDYSHPRQLDKSVIQRLITGAWIKKSENIIFTGPTGVGKTWLACALANKACRDGFDSLYRRLPILLQEISISRGDGTYPKLMEKLAKPHVIILDDFGLAPLNDMERRDLLEVIEARQGRRSTVVTSQLQVKHWHEIIGEPTIADAILDRMISGAHRIDMKGKSLRPKRQQSSQNHDRQTS